MFCREWENVFGAGSRSVPDGRDDHGGPDGPGEDSLVRGPTCQGLIGLVSSGILQFGLFSPTI